MELIHNLIENKNVLFISTKNKEYIRNQQEISLLKEKSKSYEEIVFSDRSYLKRILRVWITCCKKKWNRADIIFVGFAPQLVWPFLGRWKKHTTVIIDFFISMYDTCVNDRKYFKATSGIAKLLYKIDKLTLRKCHYIIVDTNADKKFFSKEFGISPDKLHVMYLEADTHIYHAMRYDMSCNTDKISVLYFGSILPLQGVDIILTAAKLLQKHKDIIFTIIGPVETGEKNIRMQEYPNVRFYKWMPQEELAKEVARADLCLAGHFNAGIDKAKRTIPGKAYIYEAMKKPMILGDNPANHELFQEDDEHFYVEMGNAQALADKIILICKQLKYGKEIGDDEKGK